MGKKNLTLKQFVVELALKQIPDLSHWVGLPQTGFPVKILDGDDGDLNKGLPLTGPRFTVFSNNLIFDDVTGRLWVADPSKLGPPFSILDYTWTERYPAGVGDKTWGYVASDADGSNLIAGADYDRLYTSSDYGATWVERRPAGDVDKRWFGVASDADGSHLIACVFGGRLYTSSNYGVNWVERRPAGNVDNRWFCVASDADGSNLIAGAYDRRLYTSSDYGETWTERRPAGDVNKKWNRVASDADGSNLIACADYDRLYTSSNYGETWTERRPAGNVDNRWSGVASDADGSNLIAGVFNGRLYTAVGTGELLKMTWQEAIDACLNLNYADLSDWRMPNIKELASLLLILQDGTFVDHNIFKVEDEYYWSSTTYHGDINKAWCVNWSDGLTYMLPKESSQLLVLPVKGIPIYR